MDFLIGSAFAQAAPATAQPAWMSMLPLILVFLVMYFLMIRPQKKRYEEEQKFISKLNHGDEIFTKSGILGKITAISEKVVTLELEGGSKMKVLKTHIGGSAQTLLQAEKK